MTSAQRVRAALNHQQPDKVPVDFGGTPVTGIHVSVIEGLRKELKLEPHPIRIWEPYQMLGEIEADLIDALGVDIAPTPAYKTMFGYPVEDFKPWMTPWGQKVLVPGKFNYVVDAAGDTLDRKSVGISRRRHHSPSQRENAQGQFLFRHHHPPGRTARG